MREKKGFHNSKLPPVATLLDPSLLDIFLSFVHSHPQPKPSAIPSPLSLEHLVALYDFANTFECWEFFSTLIAQIDRYSPVDLLALLQKAAGNDDVQLAKSVIHRLTPEKVRVIGFWKTVDALKPEWRIPFIRAMLPSGEPALMFNVLPSSRSDNFNPPQMQKPTKRK